MRRVMLGALGLLLWLVTQAIGLGLTGAGHGWYGALIFSLPLVVLYPLAFIRAFGSKAESPQDDMRILIAAAVLDLLLLSNMFLLDHDYFIKMGRFDPTIVTVWIALWAGWQVLGVVALLRRRPAVIREESA